MENEDFLNSFLIWAEVQCKEQEQQQVQQRLKNKVQVQFSAS